MSAYSAEFFLEAILAEPHDDDVRLIYSDWLTERDDPRGELIRVQCQLSKLHRWDPQRIDLEWQARALLARHGRLWREELPRLEGIRWGGFERGFVASVAAESFAALVQQAAAIQRAAPVRRATITAADEAAVLSRLPVLPWLEELEFTVRDHLRYTSDAILLSTVRSLRPREITDRSFRGLAQSPHAAYLEELVLDRTGTAPFRLEELANSPHIKRLRSLSLANQWQGEFGPVAGIEGARILAESESFSHLVDLNFAGNRLSNRGMELLAASPNLARLKRLDVSRNGLGLQAMQAIATSTTLRPKSLSLEGNNIGDHGMPILADAPSLAELADLNIGSCGITSHGAAALPEAGFASSLRSLNLSYNSLGPSGMRALAFSGRLKGLTALELNRCGLGCHGGRILAESPTWQRLKRLNLRDNQLGSLSIAHLAATPFLKNLRELQLDDNEIDAEGAQALAASPVLAGLCSLSLSKNPLCDRGVAALAASRQLGQIQVLELWGIEMTWRGVETLAQHAPLPSLHELCLNDNSLGCRGAQALAAAPWLSQLVALHLIHCDIDNEGARALTAANLLNLESIDFRVNPLSTVALSQFAEQWSRRGAGHLTIVPRSSPAVDTSSLTPDFDA